jgi:hypothetical protein
LEKNVKRISSTNFGRRKARRVRSIHGTAQRRVAFKQTANRMEEIMQGNYRRGGFVHQLPIKNDDRNPKTNLKPAHHSQETPIIICQRRGGSLETSNNHSNCGEPPMNLRPTLLANATANDVNHTIRIGCVKRTLQTSK